jgi:hypothetical protein
MALTNLQRLWRHAAEKRGLKVRAPFVLPLPDGTKLTAEVLLEGFGAPNGMFIVSDYRRFRDHTDAIIDAGFGYTCMSQPSPAEILSLAGIDACLEDWKNETA